MKKVYTAADMIDAELFKDSLLQQGISAIVKGALLTGIAGEVPLDQFPTVWVEDDSDEDFAKKSVVIYEKRIVTVNAGQYWRCKQCGESLEPQFAQCWSCGAEKENSAD